MKIKKLDDALNYLIRELNSMISIEESSLELNDSISNKIVIYSFITLGIMIVLGILETYFVKEYLERKKYI